MAAPLRNRQGGCKSLPKIYTMRLVQRFEGAGVATFVAVFHPLFNTIKETRLQRSAEALQNSERLSHYRFMPVGLQPTRRF
ncbi:MAG: hypothetical protein K0Q81_2030 [Paenibacillus sp.]|nr:hypothetical protein [Paenibacillus sp.]